LENGLPQIVFADPDWFFWAVEEDAFKGALRREAEDIARKAKRIRIPDAEPGEKKVRYYIDPNVGKLANVEVIEASRSPHVGSSATRESLFFDLSMARRISRYDKTGGRFVVSAIKAHVLGGRTTRLTKERCEAFFEEPRNFG
jgi:hypothetical protein